MTDATPITPSEVELYRVLERAHLLTYYSSFIAQGGDDVTQIAEAGEEEFNEILTLVGMSKKVLHVRRFQKVLAEWKQDRTRFRQPFNSAPSSSTNSHLDTGLINPFQGIPGMPGDSGFATMWTSSTSYQHLKNFPTTQSMPSAMQTTAAIINSMNSGNISLPFTDPSTTMSPKMLSEGVPVSMLPNVILSPHQLEMIATAASDLTRVLPPYPAREVNAKKQISRAINSILIMPLDDPKRESEIRKFSPIYGRFDSPRRTGRPMTFHEVAVNEAAAQLCMLTPSLLTRRDDLFGLARHVVKMMEQNFHASTSSAMQGAEAIPGEQGFDSEVACSKEDILNMQNRLQVLNATIVEVVAQQDESRRIMKANKSDQTLLLGLQHKLDELTNRQSKITHEQAMIITQLRKNGASIPSARETFEKKMFVKEEAEDSGYLPSVTSSTLGGPVWASEEPFTIPTTGTTLFPTGQIEITTPPVSESSESGETR